MSNQVLAGKTPGSPDHQKNVKKIHVFSCILTWILRCSDGHVQRCWWLGLHCCDQSLVKSSPSNLGERSDFRNNQTLIKILFCENGNLVMEGVKPFLHGQGLVVHDCF